MYATARLGQSVRASGVMRIISQFKFKKMRTGHLQYRREKLSESEREMACEILQRVYDCLQFDPEVSEPSDTPHSDEGRWTDGGRFIISMSREKVLELDEIIKKI